MKEPPRAGQTNLFGPLRGSANRFRRSVNLAPMQFTIGFVVTLIGLAIAYVVYRIFSHQ